VVSSDRRAVLDRWRGVLLAGMGGALFASTAPPTDFYPAVLLGLALLAAALGDARTVLRAAGRGIVWGTTAGLVGLRFVPEVVQRFTSLGPALGWLALVLLAAAQSLSWGLGAAVMQLVRVRARAPAPVAFAAATLVALSVPTVFAWTPAGLLSPWPWLVQLADVIGERGVSAVLAAASALVAGAALCARVGRRRDALAQGLAAVAIVAGLAVHGWLRMRSVADASVDLARVRVGLVDQAVGPLDRWDAKNHASIMATLRELTREAEAAGVELTVWPEAAYPFLLDHGTRIAPRKKRAVVGQGVRGPVLMGLITRAPPVVGTGRVEENTYNSATIVSPDGAMQPMSDKLELLWFGETVPGGAYLPWLRRTFQRSGGLLPGDAPRALELERGDSTPVRLGVLNCYEDTLPTVGRRVMRALEPSLLVNITNDAWFVGTAEPELHARLAVMRAIEHRRDLVRAVNLGVTSWIDATGRVRLRDEAKSPRVRIVEPALRHDALTFYVRFGDAPAAGVLLLVIVGFAVRSRWASRRGLSAP
jgi:apolipoprotein N-acyltransferase